MVSNEFIAELAATVDLELRRELNLPDAVPQDLAERIRAVPPAEWPEILLRVLAALDASGAYAFCYECQLIALIEQETDLNYVDNITYEQAVGAISNMVSPDLGDWADPAELPYSLHAALCDLITGMSDDEKLQLAEESVQAAFDDAECPLDSEARDVVVSECWSDLVEHFDSTDIEATADTGSYKTFGAMKLSNPALLEGRNRLGVIRDLADLSIAMNRDPEVTWLDHREISAFHDDVWQAWAQSAT